MLAKPLIAFGLLCVSSLLHAQTYEQGITQLSGKIAQSVESKGAQVATVLDLNSLDGSVTQLGKLVAQDLFDQLVSGAPSVSWIDPSRRDFILKENQLAADRLMDPATQKQLGKLLGLSVIVSGTVTELGDSARIQLRAVEIETARVIGSASTTVELPDALKRLNDRRSSAPAIGTSSRPEVRNETFVIRPRYVSLLDYNGQEFMWVTSLELENISGGELYVRITGMSVGACSGYREVNGLASWGREYYNGEERDREKRLGLATLMVPGKVTTITVKNTCYRENLAAFSSGLVDVSVDLAVDFGDKYARLSMSVPDAKIQVNSAAK
jgi:FlgO protein